MEQHQHNPNLPSPQFVAVSLTDGDKKHRNMDLVTLSVVKLLASHDRTNWQYMNHIRVMVKLDGKTEISSCAEAEILRYVIYTGTELSYNHNYVNE
jgi:hypothetical protein